MTWHIPKPQAITKIPQELWYDVFRRLPSITAGYAARIFKRKLGKRQELERDIWKSIFKDERWLRRVTGHEFGMNPVLIGRDLEKLFDGQHSLEDCYFVLVAADVSGQRSFLAHDFRKSLMPHEWRGAEAQFESGLKVNIGNVMSSGPEYNPVRLDRIFRYEDEKLATSCLSYLEGGAKLRTLGSEDINCTEGKATSPSHVRSTCGLIIPSPLGGSVHYCFMNHDFGGDLGRRQDWWLAES